MSNAKSQKSKVKSQKSKVNKINIQYSVDKIIIIYYIILT